MAELWQIQLEILRSPGGIQSQEIYDSLCTLYFH